MGENPAMSDPNLNHARNALSKLDHMVVQDIFFTETCGYADVILPASAFPEKDGTFTNTDRRVQLGRQAVDPPGEAKQDLWIIQEIANRMGLNWNYKATKDVFNEIRVATPSMAGITWERLEKVDSLTYPLTNVGDPGEPIIFKDGIFPTQDGKGSFIAADYTEPAELPNNDFPFVFITGRFNINYNCGSTFPNKIKNLVKKHKVNIGISLDGDADRIILCDEKGRIIDGDQIIAMLAQRWRRRNQQMSNHPD